MSFFVFSFRRLSNPRDKNLRIMRLAMASVACLTIFKDLRVFPRCSVHGPSKSCAKCRYSRRISLSAVPCASRTAFTIIFQQPTSWKPSNCYPVKKKQKQKQKQTNKTKQKWLPCLTNAKRFQCFPCHIFFSLSSTLQSIKTKIKLSHANSIPYSQAVTHPSTNGTRHSLTSGSWRDRVSSMWYGRWQDFGRNYRDISTSKYITCYEIFIFEMHANLTRTKEEYH